jgi:hypothetical protein
VIAVVDDEESVRKAVVRAGAIEFLLHRVCLESKSVARTLHDGPTRGGLATHEYRNTDNALITDNGNSAEAPFSITYSRDTMEVVGKYTCLSVPPDSYRTDPKGISTDSRSGSQRAASAGGNAAIRRFWLAWANAPMEVRTLVMRRPTFKTRQRPVNSLGLTGRYPDIGFNRSVRYRT